MILFYVLFIFMKYNQNCYAKKNMCVYCHMLQKIRVGRSEIIFFLIIFIFYNWIDVGWHLYSSKKVLHHLYFIHVFLKILQTARKITTVYW